jgi:hypothetical protein
MTLGELGYQIVIIDSDLVSFITTNDYLMDGLDDFCNQGRIFVRENPHQLADFVKKSNGGIISSNFVKFSFWIGIPW